MVNWGPFYEKKFKKSHNVEQTERGDPLGFFNIHCVSKLQKFKGGPFGGKKLFEKSRTMPKKRNWDPVMYVTQKKETLFWLSSLDQHVQFGAYLYIL